jgi:hypothetical protein
MEGRVPQLLPIHLLNRGSLLGLSDGNWRFLSYSLAYNLLAKCSFKLSG